MSLRARPTQKTETTFVFRNSITYTNYGQHSLGNASHRARAARCYTEAWASATFNFNAWLYSLVVKYQFLSNAETKPKLSYPRHINQRETILKEGSLQQLQGLGFFLFSLNFSWLIDSDSMCCVYPTRKTKMQNQQGSLQLGSWVESCLLDFWLDPTSFSSWFQTHITRCKYILSLGRQSSRRQLGIDCWNLSGRRR